MKTREKLQPVWVTEYAEPAPVAVASENVPALLKDAQEAFSEERSVERVTSMLKQIVQNAEKILRANRDADPLIVANDTQATLAKSAFVRAKLALKYLHDGNKISAMYWGMIAMSELEKAIAVPYVASAKRVRGRALETHRRVRGVAAVGKEFSEKHNRPPQMGRVSDFKEVNERLRARGQSQFEFTTHGAFRTWKSKLKPGLPW